MTSIQPRAAQAPPKPLNTTPQGVPAKAGQQKDAPPAQKSTIQDYTYPEAVEMIARDDASIAQKATVLRTDVKSILNDVTPTVALASTGAGLAISGALLPTLWDNFSKRGAGAVISGIALLGIPAVTGGLSTYFARKGVKEHFDKQNREIDDSVKLVQQIQSLEEKQNKEAGETRVTNGFPPSVPPPEPLHKTFNA